MYCLHGLLSGARREPRLSRSETSWSRWRTLPPEKSRILRLRSQILPQLQAVRGCLPVERAYRRYYTARANYIRPQAGEVARPYAGRDRFCGNNGIRLRTHYKLYPRAETGKGRPRRHICYRQTPNIPQILRREICLMVQKAGSRPEGFPKTGGILPRMLCELQPSRARQSICKNYECRGIWCYIAREREMLRRCKNCQPSYRPCQTRCRD